MGLEPCRLTQVEPTCSKIHFGDLQKRFFTYVFLREKQIPPIKYVEFFRGSPGGNSTFQATFASPGFAISVDLRSTRAWCGGSYPWKNLNDLWGGCTRCIRIFTWFQLRQGVGLGGLVRVESRSVRCKNLWGAEAPGDGQGSVEW